MSAVDALAPGARKPYALPLAGSPFELRTTVDAEPSPPHPAGEWGHVHSIFPGSTVDGPGVRMVIFLSGCHFRCHYCHNPDTWKIGSGQRVGIDEMLKTIEGYAKFLRSAHGGITISGGEPLVQSDFVMSIARGAKRMGLSVALDTNGIMGDRLSDADLNDIDLVLLDIKESDPARHLTLTQQPLEPVLDFARRLDRLHRPVWIRFVLVPGLTDSDDTLHGMRRIIDGLSNVQRIDILPFHQMGKFKWKELGLDYRLADTPTPTPQQVNHARVILCEGKQLS